MFFQCRGMNYTIPTSDSKNINKHEKKIAICSKENLLEGLETAQYSHQSNLHTIHLQIYDLNNG